MLYKKLSSFIDSLTKMCSKKQVDIDITFCFVIMCMRILFGKVLPEMTYTVSGGTLSPIHLVTHCWFS